MRNCERWNRRLTAVVVGFGVALSMLTARHWYETLQFGHPLCENCRPDFPQFYAAAKLIWESPGALYNEAMQFAIQHSIDPRIKEILPYTYPPVTAIVLIPLGWLSFRTAYAVMTVLNLLLLGLALKILIIRLELTRAQSLWLILTSLCSFGVHSVILQGQVSFIPLILLTVFIGSVQNKRWIAAGLTTALLFVKPQLQGAPVLILLGRRMWRAVVLASIGVIGLVIISICAVSWSGIQQYLSLLRTYLTVEQGYGSYPEAMHNLRALSQFLVRFTWSPYLWITLTSGVIGAVILLNNRFYNDAKMIDLQWIGNFTAGILLAPHLYPHDLAIAIVPTALALKLAGEPVPIWLTSLLTFLGIYPLFGVMFANRLLPIVPVILIAILFWCVWSVRGPAKWLYSNDRSA